MANIDEEGGIGMNNFANFKDDGSANSKQRLELLTQLYSQNLSDYREYLEKEHQSEKDPVKKEQKIEQELAIYEASLFNRFFPEIMELEKKVEQEEKSSKRKPVSKAVDPNDQKKTDEKNPNDKKEEEKADERRNTIDEPKSSNELEPDAKPKTKTQQLLDRYDDELKGEGINFDSFKEKEGFDLEHLNDVETQKLSDLCYKGLRFSIDKSEANQNPRMAIDILKNNLSNISSIIASSYTL